VNELPQWASVWLRVTVIDTDAWTTEGSPMTTFETPCGETFRVFSEGLEIVPVSPVRADARRWFDGGGLVNPRAGSCELICRRCMYGPRQNRSGRNDRRRGLDRAV
jgi:hypothetical protein